MQASHPDTAEGLINFFKQAKIPYVSTFQGAGAWVAKESGATYGGRIGLFRNQPADKVLDEADAVLTIGYDPIEYDPSIWNVNGKRPVICVDVIPAQQDNAFLPVTELIGDISESLSALAKGVNIQFESGYVDTAKAAVKEIQDTLAEGQSMSKFPVQPLRLVHELQKQMTPNTYVALDVRSNYIWTYRDCAADFSRQVLVSNGQQTLGVSIPCAIRR